MLRACGENIIEFKDVAAALRETLKALPSEKYIHIYIYLTRDTFSLCSLNIPYEPERD